MAGFTTLCARLWMALALFCSVYVLLSSPAAAVDIIEHDRFQIVNNANTRPTVQTITATRRTASRLTQPPQPASTSQHHQSETFDASEDAGQQGSAYANFMETIANEQRKYTRRQLNPASYAFASTGIPEILAISKDQERACLAVFRTMRRHGWYAKVDHRNYCKFSCAFYVEAYGTELSCDDDGTARYILTSPPKGKPVSPTNFEETSTWMSSQAQGVIGWLREAASDTAVLTEAPSHLERSMPNAGETRANGLLFSMAWKAIVKDIASALIVSLIVVLTFLRYDTKKKDGNNLVIRFSILTAVAAVMWYDGKFTQLEWIVLLSCVSMFCLTRELHTAVCFTLIVGAGLYIALIMVAICDTLPLTIGYTIVAISFIWFALVNTYGDKNLASVTFFPAILFIGFVLIHSVSILSIPNALDPHDIIFTSFMPFVIFRNLMWTLLPYGSSWLGYENIFGLAVNTTNIIKVYIPNVDPGQILLITLILFAAAFIGFRFSLHRLRLPHQPEFDAWAMWMDALRYTTDVRAPLRVLTYWQNKARPTNHGTNARRFKEYMVDCGLTALLISEIFFAVEFIALRVFVMLGVQGYYFYGKNWQLASQLHEDLIIDNTGVAEPFWFAALEARRGVTHMLEESKTAVAQVAVVAQRAIMNRAHDDDLVCFPASAPGADGSILADILPLDTAVLWKKDDSELQSAFPQFGASDWFHYHMLKPLSDAVTTIRFEDKMGGYSFGTGIMRADDEDKNCFTFMTVAHVTRDREGQPFTLGNTSHHMLDRNTTRHGYAKDPVLEIGMTQGREQCKPAHFQIADGADLGNISFYVLLGQSNMVTHLGAQQVLYDSKEGMTARIAANLRKGDSGSPLFGFVTTDQTFKYVGCVSAGNNDKTRGNLVSLHLHPGAARPKYIPPDAKRIGYRNPANDNDKTYQLPPPGMKAGDNFIPRQDLPQADKNKDGNAKGRGKRTRKSAPVKIGKQSLAYNVAMGVVLAAEGDEAAYMSNSGAYNGLTPDAMKEKRKAAIDRERQFVEEFATTTFVQEALLEITKAWNKARAIDDE